MTQVGGGVDAHSDLLVACTYVHILADVHVRASEYCRARSCTSGGPGLGRSNLRRFDLPKLRCEAAIYFRGTVGAVSACTGVRSIAVRTEYRVAEASDAVSFETFYRAQADRVYRSLAVALADSQLAREAADEAMTRAYARWKRVGALDNPGGWVFRVGLNWATSRWRKLRRERFVPVEVAAAAGPSSAGVVAAQVALTRLPLAYRTVIVCRVLLDLSTAQTATVLGLPEGTVKSRLARGLAALRAELTEEVQS
ncbi:MAG: hypothetical protein HOU81_12580 [Hamadaea sp.]|nr:hypothetical protein [Hamadaea sp.]NUT20213.1 hypothetical protein [Hamadaea sp.]